MKKRLRRFFGIHSPGGHIMMTCWCISDRQRYINNKSWIGVSLNWQRSSWKANNHGR